MTSRDKNLDSYGSLGAVEQYTNATTLSACEAYLFGKYIDGSKEILDLGVGAGRTTPYLAAQASLYVGLDYSETLVEICRKKFPSLRFVCDDATNLKQFASDSFDVVVFSHNGIDSLGTDQDRTRCFREVARVLRPGGRFIFSSHNARSIGLAANLRKYLFDRVEPDGATDLVSKARSLAVEEGRWRLVRQFLRSIRISAQFSVRSLFAPKMYKGTGYYHDYSHGGLTLFASTPEYVLAESKNAGFEILETVSNTYPAVQPYYKVQWYYFVLNAKSA